MKRTENNYPLKEETSIIIGIGMEIHRLLGPGFLEIVYKDAMDYEFKNQRIDFNREKAYPILYKNIILSHQYFSDFTVFDKIILEVKAKSKITDLDLAQIINYLKASGNKVGLILNFGIESLGIKRVIY